MVLYINGIIYKSFLCYGKLKKKSGEIKNKLRKITIIIIKILRTKAASLESNYWLLKSEL